MENVPFSARIGYRGGMGKKDRILLAVLLVAGTGGVAWHALRPTEPQEPVYQGKRLSVWLNDYWISNISRPGDEVLISNNNYQVDNVVRQIGTNAIPTLFRMLNAADSPTTKLDFFLAKHDAYNGRLKSTPLAFEQQYQAAHAFRALGADARGAVPRLIDMYDKSQDEGSKNLVAFALGGIGPPASNVVPSLLHTLTNPALPWVPYSTLRALGEIHAEPKNVVPILTNFLKNPDVNARMRSIRSLQAFGAEAQPAVPALVESLADKVDYIRKGAAEALKIIDPEAAAKAGVQ
jgi:hypothetical protein